MHLRSQPQARSPWGGERGGLVANGEAILAVLGVLEFVDEGDRVVLEGNTAVGYTGLLDALDKPIRSADD